MSDYACMLTGSKFIIKTENFGAVLNALVDEAKENTVYNNPSFGPYQVGPVDMPLNVSFEEVETVAAEKNIGAQQDMISAFFRRQDYYVGFDGKGNITSLTRTAEKWRNDHLFFDVFAKQVEKGSYIEMGGEDGDTWRMYFDGEHCREVHPVITWPGIDDEVTEEVFLDEAELLTSVENAEIGRVYDDIDQFFDYMFNEVDSFNDFVSMLTPELKEAIVFAQEWNGGVVKANGQYYYSSDFDGNFIADGKTPSFNKYAVAKEVELEDFKNALECLDYSPDDYTEEELREMSDDHYDKLGNDDVYNAIYNETLEEVVKAHEKVASVDKLVENAAQACADMNKDNESKSDVEFGKV